MSNDNHNSDSALQQKKEADIIRDFLKSKEFYSNIEENNSEKTFTIEKSSKIKMQFDLYLQEGKTIGEVYVTELPFNSGRKRKFQSDILKMITFEKKIGAPFRKLYFLTADEEKLKSIHSNVLEGDFYKHTREKSLIGKDTWLNLTLDLYSIELYYYCIDKDFFKELKVTRVNQKTGMRS